MHSVFCKCKHQIPSMSKGEIKMKNNMLSKLILAALTATLTVSMASCAQNAVSESSLQPESVEQQQVVSAAGTLLLSVNPEIEVEYDKQGLVLEIEGLNDDGKSVISQYQDYQGKACAEVVRELVQQIHQGGYFENQLAGHTRNIVVKLEDGSVCPNGEFLEEVADGVREAVNQIGISSVPMMVGIDDLDDQGRIGTAKARELALNQMGLTDAVFSEGEYELDDGIYELEFTADGVEYEYEVDAITGKVLEADYYDLMKNKGVGEETALFLSMLPRLFDIFKEDKEENDINFLRSPYECVKYFRSKYEIKNKEFLYVVCLNNSCKIMKTIIIEGNSDNSVSIDIKKFANMINNENTASIVLFHTHPNGEVKPSREDILTTQNILNICCIMNVVLCDHIILNEKDYFSFGRDNLLFDMYNKFSKNFSLSISNKQDMCQHIGFKYDE